MEDLFTDEIGFVCFKIEWSPGDFITSASFTVHRVIEWDEAHSPSETEPYMSGWMKWDGCAEIEFEESHFCSKSEFRLHGNALMALWDACSKKIAHFDKKKDR